MFSFLKRRVTMNVHFVLNPWVLQLWFVYFLYAYLVDNKKGITHYMDWSSGFRHIYDKTLSYITFCYLYIYDYNECISIINNAMSIVKLHKKLKVYYFLKETGPVCWMVTIDSLTLRNELSGFKIDLTSLFSICFIL